MGSNIVVTATTASHGIDLTTLIFQTSKSVARTPTKALMKHFMKNVKGRTGLESTTTKTSRLDGFCIKVDNSSIKTQNTLKSNETH